MEIKNDVCSVCGDEILPNSLNYCQDTYDIIRCEDCYTLIFNLEKIDQRS